MDDIFVWVVKLLFVSFFVVFFKLLIGVIKLWLKKKLSINDVIKVINSFNYVGISYKLMKNGFLCFLLIL